MKKTLITSALIAAMTAPAVMAEGDSTYTIQTDQESYEQNRGNYYGFTLKLTDSFLDATASDAYAPTLSTLSEVVLNSVAIEQRDTTGSGHVAYLAVYEYASDGTTGNFIALSTNTNNDEATGGYNTFNFADVTIDPNKQYQFLFVGSTATPDEVSSFEGYKENATQFGFSMSNIDSLPKGDGTYTNSNLNSWEGFYIPNVSISVSVTPEPTTATLSLLALAGLCARRRRK